MKLKKFFAAVTSGFLALSAIPAVTPASVTAADQVVISPYNKFEINDGIFEGWGTSLCWWANRLGYSDSLAKQSAEAFCGDEGLRMNILRYNIGGGDDPSHTHITRTDSNMPGYTVYKNGQVTYDWNADYNQRNVLFKCLETYGDDLIVEMFSNSPPYYMTQSGCTSGNTDGGKNNLKDDQYTAFAEYLANVCEHYEKDWGVHVQSVEAMNEPYTNFWYAGSPKQEGCHFDIGNCESKIINELDKAMKARGLGDVIICGTDETSIDTQIDAYNKLDSNAKKAVTRIDTHTYGGSKRTELKNLAVQNGVNLWMSEVDGGSTAGTNNGEMGSALWLADRMVADVNGLNASAWVLWQAIDNHISSVGYNGNKDKGMVNVNGGFWGLAVADHDNDTIVLTKKYYAFGQFSRYIRPGFTMLNSSGNTVVGYDTKNDQLVIVAVNDGGGARDMEFDLSQFDSVGTSAKVIRTSGSMASGENWKELSPIALNGSKLNASLIANSITTFIIDGVKSSAASFTEIPLNKSMVTGSDAWKQSTENDYTKVVDGSLTTYFDGLENGYVQIDLGQAYDLTAVAIAPRQGYEARCVDAVISVSSDGVNWETAATVNFKPFNGLNYLTKLSSNTGVRYVKYQVPKGAPQNSYNNDNVYNCNLAEIKLYGQLSGLSDKIDLSDKKLSGSNAWNNSNNDYKKAFDGKVDTYFDGVGNGWVEVDLGSKYDITTIGYAPRSGYEYRMTDGSFYGSNDGETWEKIYTITSKPNTGMNYVSTDDKAQYRYIKYQVPEGAPTNSDNPDSVYCCNIAEIQLFGTEVEEVIGDVNADGECTIADAVMLQSWLLNKGKVTDWQAADLCKDGVLDVYDLIMLKKLIA